MTIIEKGNVEYMNKIEDTQGNIKTLAIWTIPDYMKTYHDMAIGEVHSPGKTFRFATAINRDKQFIKIHYLSKMKQTCYLKSVELKSLIFNQHDWKFEQEHSIAKKEHEITPNNKWKFLALLKIDESEGFHYITDTKKIVSFLDNGSLRLSFEFVITTNKTKPNNFNIPATKLKDLFTNMFHEGTFSDVVIKSSDGDEFKAHKVLLASQSPVLKASFDHNFTESSTNVVESPLETAVLHEMLSFIYTDEAKIDDMPEKLLAAADYYQLNRLKSLCEKVLYEQLTVDNAIETLQLADLHSAGTLLQLTLEYINKNNEQLRLVTKTEGWVNLKSIDLIKKIFE